MSQLRDDALSIFNAGVDAVRAMPLVQRVVLVDAQKRLRIDGCEWDLNEFDRVIVIGGGKAATSMAQGLIESLRGILPVTGWINVPEGTVKAIPGLTVHPARPAGVNEPTEAGVQGTEAILKLVENASERDLCIALISGGGSALLPAPASGITLADKLAVTRFLSAAGANIEELNTVRKHLSRVKGGRLLAASRAGAFVTLVLSDVLGDPLDLIASGPTVPDSSSPQDAVQVLQRYDSDQKLPAHITRFLAKTTNRFEPAASSTIVIGNNRVAVDASHLHAISLGYTCLAESASSCEGDASVLGRELADRLVALLRDGSRTGPVCLISGGEPTVELADEAIRGKGGRNQQLVLAVYQHLATHHLSPEEWANVSFLSAGTDGEDGPTDAAGAVIDAGVHERLSAVDSRLGEFIRRNDAYPLLSRAGGLVTTGPTGTNVCDLRVFIAR